MITTIIVHLVTHLHVLMDIHLQLANVVHVEQYLELAINAIRPIFIAIHVQRGMYHLCLVFMDTHLQLRRHVLAVLHLDFAINVTYRLLLPVQALAFLHILDLAALLQAVLALRRRAVLLVVQVHHLHQVLVLHQNAMITVVPDKADLHVLEDRL